MTPIDTIVEALRKADQLLGEPPAAIEISGITDDSRRASRGVLFCAVEGTVEDGHRYVKDAKTRGAAAAIVTRRLDVPIPQVLVRDSRHAASIAAASWYGHPGASLDVIGVTGTNGKTTTVALLRHLMNVQGSAGSIGTLGAIDGAGEMLSGYGDLTTPGSIEVHAVLAELRARGVRSVAIEASSHALDQNRLALIALRGAVFTNLTHDHLDYHGSMDRYRAAKGRLSDLLASGAIEVVNEDDPAWQVLGPRDGVRRIGFGRRAGGEVQARDVRLEATGSSAVFSFAGEDCPVRVPLLGDFNVENALAAAAAAWGLGGEPTTIAERLATMPPVTGRLEPLHSGAFQVHRDYCHTPDALERAIAVLRPLTAGRLIVLFGAGGDRDRSKRASMGRVVEQGADLAIVTSDNPRTEDPERIVDEIAAGMSGRRQVRIVDRLVAIEYAVGILEAGDCLLLAGKGHEDYQVVGTERYPFDERTIVRSLMREPEE